MYLSTMSSKTYCELSDTVKAVHNKVSSCAVTAMISHGWRGSGRLAAQMVARHVAVRGGRRTKLLPTRRFRFARIVAPGPRQQAFRGCVSQQSIIPICRDARAAAPRGGVR